MPNPGVGPGGAPGPKALRTPVQFAVSGHQATTAVVAKAYPFLAEGGLGSQGVMIGRDMHAGGAFVYDPWVLYGRGMLTNPNLLLAGVIGTGKSALAKSLATRSIAFGRRVYVPSDPKGEWTAVAEAVGGSAITLGPGMSHRLNPLDAGPRAASLSDEEWTRQVRSRRRVLLGALTAQMLDRPLRPTEHTALDIALDASTRADGSPKRQRTPILPEITETLFDPPAVVCEFFGETPERVQADARDVAHALLRLVRGDLAGLFDAPSTVEFDPGLPMVSLDLSRLAGGEGDLSLAVAMTCASTWMEAALSDPDGGQRWVIYDEAWRIMRYPALLARMQAQWKLSRALGLANMMVIHRLSDLDAVGDADSAARKLAEGLLADCSTRVMYRQESDQLTATAELLDLTDVERQAISQLPKARGLWKVSGGDGMSRSFVVQHQAHPDELRVFDTDVRMTGTAEEEEEPAAPLCRFCGDPMTNSTSTCLSCGSSHDGEDSDRPPWLIKEENP